MNFHAVSHSLPHRGPGASRARTRWQPYAPNIGLSTVQRPSPSPALHLHTPASSVSSAATPLSSHVLPLSDPERLRALALQSSPANTVRDAQKSKYAAKLVDQAVKSLCETWHPDDIPTVFTACGRESLCAQPEPPTADSQPLCSPTVMAAGFSKLFATRNTQLPSPVSPTTRPSPSPPANGCESYSQAPESSGGSNLIPIRGFVHEVLRRSRTSTGVLQTALCYLEAVRSRVPELLRKEKTRPTSEYGAEQDAEPRIVQGLPEEDDFRGDGIASDVPNKAAVSNLDTVRVEDAQLAAEGSAGAARRPVPSACRSKEQDELPALPPLPSPLCCPRRTFLACLILASKFMQDRSYSNRAWAKLAGLPPREIGRCERAVGEALEWRLWVGKLPTSSASSASSGTRPFGRTKSDGDLLAGSAGTYASSAAAAWAPSTAANDAQGWIPSASQTLASLPASIPPARQMRTLQRSATAPAIGSSAPAAPADVFLAPMGQVDGYGYAGADLAPGLTAFTMEVDASTEVSPSLSTPTLSYSPMSCASSSSDGSEERTIQMSMFVDLPTPSLSYTTAGPSSRGPWVANSSAYTPADPANPHASTHDLSSLHRYYNHSQPMYDEAGAAAENAAETALGPTLAAIDTTTKTKAHVPTALPSFAEAFPGRCPGMLGYGTR
ncbi:hypothetical protein PYCCODRAFT_1431072 [Trametes coccinea BRFM310]|uniref:Cyclin N-terminal domain-containing protein n=1 Tax=Trametes coccinea (strain BRFM310) TaxID=1353009 RepID=A0A1Y2J0F2_TRAC3|nr:hypothetical protein PYCCODRAFT_1431072 [Trametes coccinea BRFM310]